MVEWSCTDKRNKPTWTLIFGRIVLHKKRINERGSYVFAAWSRVIKRNKSMRDLIFGRMVEHKRKIK